MWLLTVPWLMTELALFRRVLSNGHQPEDLAVALGQLDRRHVGLVRRALSHVGQELLGDPRRDQRITRSRCLESRMSSAIDASLTR